MSSFLGQQVAIEQPLSAAHDTLTLLLFFQLIGLGFTGRLVARYLSENYPMNGGSGLKWAMAGRDANKLQGIKDKFGIDNSVDVLVADSNDAASLDAVAGQTRVVLTTAGPFARIGTPVVDACVRQGTNYCDITGEVQWVREMIDKHHDAA